MKSRTMQPIRMQRRVQSQKEAQRSRVEVEERNQKRMERTSNIRRLPTPPPPIKEVKKRRLIKKSKDQSIDYNLLLAIIFLTCFGLVMLYSTSAYSARMDFNDDMYYFSKQAIISGGSFVVMLLVSKIDYHIFGAYSIEIFMIAMVLMVLVQTPLGIEVYGARRWIQLPGNLTLQPSELTKIGVILYISYELCRLSKKIKTREVFVRIFGLGAIAAGGVLFLTENLSTAIIVFLITCVLYFVVHPRTKGFLVIVFVVILCSSLAKIILANTIETSDNFRIRRILTWVNPEKYADEGGFQVMQGLYAIGSGGFWGKGLGNSTQKLGVIPEVQNDMILTIVCEELGVFGVIMILMLFAFLLRRLLLIAREAPDMYGSLIVTGIAAHIAWQVFLNVAVVTSMIPTTGITLPFISYGGTSILFLMSELGIALGVSRKIQREEE